MKKYFTTDGRELIIDKPVTVTLTNRIDSKYRIISACELDNLLLDYLIKTKAVICKHVEEFKPSDKPSYYVHKLADKLKIPVDQFYKTIEAIRKYSPITVFSMLLKQIALELDKRYKDHIRDVDETYAISVTTGNIIKIYTKGCRYNNIALFRSVEDARFAVKVLSGLYDECFPEGNVNKQEDN